VPWVAIHPDRRFADQWILAVDLASAPGGTPRIAERPVPVGGANPNPVILPVGNSLGRYQDLGNGISFWMARC
jgi:hypothetical protein